MSVRAAERQGLGLPITCNRASIMGTTLTIQPAEPTGTRGHLYAYEDEPCAGKNQ
jgi:hypothetical protein